MLLGRGYPLVQAVSSRKYMYEHAVFKSSQKEHVIPLPRAANLWPTRLTAFTTGRQSVVTEAKQNKHHRQTDSINVI